jgi:hypothetical protein
MPQYALARHVFVCLQGEHVVFLDVRKDRYFALEAARTAGLERVVPGWPVRTSADAEAVTPVIDLLLEKEILAADLSAGKAVIPPAVETPRSDLTADAIDDPPRIGPFVVLRFGVAAARAALLLKYQSFESVVHRVSDRNQMPRNQSGEIDLARLSELVSVFATLRPFFFAAKDACLFDALALSEFLAGFRIYPRWVFGVQARPFAAHCWLQHDGIVLNDTVDHVRRYTPIMNV